LGFYSLSRWAGPFLERDFKMIREWGFDFVRMPMDYRLWVREGDRRTIFPDAFRELDLGVEWARKYGLHACLNIHRAPGYCINAPQEPKSLWTDRETREICAEHWAFLAKRFKGIPDREMSFDLLNEPDGVDNATYAQVIRLLTEAIRSQDPGRLVIADGTEVGNRPVPELIPLGVAQATRGYQPMEVSHYLAPWWKGSVGLPPPAWPMVDKGTLKDRAWMKKEFIQPWKELESQGVGVFVGEWGVYKNTPHAITLALMRDHLELWKEAGWGWALWNFRGDFGILDSNREDVAYEKYDGHLLDLKMLELLQAF
jgi:endoglucanase